MSDAPRPPVAPASSVTSPGPRRAFVARLAGLLAAWPLVGNRFVRQAGGMGRASAGPSPNADLLAAVGDAVLPAELGTSGIARATDAFRRWMDGYQPGAEASHGYGTARIDRLPADPRPQWLAQLAALDSEARGKGAASFVALPRDARQAMIRAALGAERGEALPTPLAARHIVLAFLAHFYESAAATDLCYDAQIGRQECRPLAAQRQQPVALGRRGR